MSRVNTNRTEPACNLSDADKIVWECVVCSEKYKPNLQYHRCNKKRVIRFNAGKKGAETRSEKYGAFHLTLTFGAALDECRAMYAGRI